MPAHSLPALLLMGSDFLFHYTVANAVPLFTMFIKQLFVHLPYPGFNFFQK